MAASVSSCAVATPKVTAVPASLSSSRSAVNGGRVVVAFPCNAIEAKSIAVSCRASAEEEDSSVVTRRSALALLAGVAAVSSRVSPADAAYGEAANVFGAPKQQSGFTPYSGEGFTVNIPTKWNPSKEVEFPGQVLRFEDNFDQLSNLSVSILPSDKKSIKDYGSPEEFLKKVSYLLGKQSYQGKTSSEGGFDPDSVASASIFNSDVKELGGKSYYDLSLLTRTGDGNEGGRHQSIVATVSDGKLYIFKAQAGDKRWFKGTQKFVEGAAKSFAVA